MSCHVTQEANLEIFLFCPNSTFNIRKSYKMSSGKALYFRSYQPKTSLGGGEHPPVPLGLINPNSDDLLVGLNPRINEEHNS